MFDWLKKFCNTSTSSSKSMTGHILVVDPSTNIRAALSELLKAQHYHVTAVQDQRAAIHVLQDDRPDLAIIEVKILETGELTLISQIKHLSQPIPIVLTGNNEKKDVHYVNQIGADGFLEKPFSEQKLLEMLTLLLSKKEDKK